MDANRRFGFRRKRVLLRMAVIALSGILVLLNSILVAAKQDTKIFAANEGKEDSNA